jgi:hypothetical protein
VQEGLREDYAQVREKAPGEAGQPKGTSMTNLFWERRPFPCVLVLFLLPLLVLLLPQVAAGAERKPFEITKLTLQTTKPTKITKEGETFHFINEPEPFTQAGGHPWALTTTVEFATEEISVPLGGGGGTHSTVPTQDPKDIVTFLPPGLLGNPNPKLFPRCPLAVALAGAGGGRCPTDTQIGVFVVGYFGKKQASLAPIVNVEPEKGQSAEFGLEGAGGPTVLLTAHVVRSGGGYGLTVVSNEIPLVELNEVELTFWGVPADPSHDQMRGLICAGVHGLAACEYRGHPGNIEETDALTGVPSGAPLAPFLIMPTDCEAGPLATSVRADSWEEPGRYIEKQAEQSLPTALGGAAHGFGGCDLLQFSPEIEVRPDKLLADEPVELGVNLRVPQVETTVAPATPQLRDSVVTLPEGMSISPGIVDGIQACNRSGPEGINFDGPESEELGLNGEPQLAPGHCPQASTVGEAEAISPLLDEPVKGHVYLARPECGGAGEAACTEEDAAKGRIYKLYLELGGQGPLANTGVNLKVEGEVQANPATGQLTTVFENTPQLPFSELKIKLNGGPRSPLDNPTACGQATTTTDFTPWSAPGITPEGLSMPGTADATPSSFFNVTGCAGPPGLRPGFTAGTVSPQAGAFSAFTLNFTRQGREQFLAGIQVHTPPGLLGMLSSVQLCEEPLAQQGACPEASRIGTTTVASGAGSHPFEISGSVYLTKGYRGAPFGLSIVTNAVAGPFNLGLVVVRARIDVDPVTSQLTVTSDPLPQIIFGVPLRLKRVTVNIDRPGFMFNPTNCSAQQITAVVSGDQNAVADVSSPFAAGGCRSLDFKPHFTVAVSGRTSKQNGASLDAKVSYPPFKPGEEANISYVKVELPKQLPSRLTTLQKACLAAVFEANPANCPSASVIGIVRASTPVLPVPLSGPVYFVSHGGEAFPSLVAVLQGDGVRVDLTGTTFIDKHGITSSTFKTVPDVPVSTFELYLPQGPYSALAANGNLCSLTATRTVRRKVTKRVRGHTIHKTLISHVATPATLGMPTEIVGQNGAVVHQSTPVQVTGCPRAAKATRAKNARRHAGRARHAR